MFDQLLAPPALFSEEETQRARMFLRLAWSTGVVATTMLAALMLVQPGVAGRALIALVTVDTIVLAGIAICRKGNVRAASWVLVSGLIALVTVLALTAGGIRSPGVTLYFIFVLMAGLLLGDRMGLRVGLGCALLATALVLVEQVGLLPSPTTLYGPYALLMLVLLYMGIIVQLSRMATLSVATALKRAELELTERRQTERRLAQALGAGKIGVWDQELRSGKFTGDAQAFAIFGLPMPPDRAMAREKWRSMIHPEDLPAMSGILSHLLEGPGHARSEYRIVRPGEDVRQVAASAIVLRDHESRPVRIAGTVVDVTEQRQSGVERERLLRSLNERVKELSLLHRAARLLREAPFEAAVLQELVELMPPAWMYPECCEARVTYGAMTASTPRWQSTPWRLSAPFVTSTGPGMLEVIYLEERQAREEGPFLPEERALLDSLAELLVSYLERHHTEQRRRGLEGQLRQSQKMQALGTLAGGIAHDFNNILTAIGGNVELALDERPADAVRTCLEEVHKAHGRAADLVNRILVFSRKQEPVRRVIHPGPVIEEALTLIRVSLPKTIEVRTVTAPDLPPISADASQLHQVIMNLATNAAHAMKETGGILEVRLERTTITANSGLAELSPGVHIRIVVSDTGAGMSQEILDRLFEPFFTTKGAAGTGLGLAVVHGIIEDHDGTIRVETELGKGTTFELYLPATTAAADTATGEDGAILPGAGEHIMYVDDEEALVFVTSRVLQRLGYRCTGYSSVSEALQEFRSTPHEFSAVITDLAMPNMSGLDFARALWRIPQDLPVAVASGYGRDASLDGTGIAKWIRKPSTIGELSRALHGILHQAA